MPIYPMECTACGDQIEILAEIKDRDDFHSCRYCNSPMRRRMEDQTVTVRPDIEPGYDQSLGVHVGSRRELRKELAYANAYCPDWGVGEPSAGRLTPEERAVEEGRQLGTRETIFEKRKRPGWGSSTREGQEDIVTEGEADYKSFIQDIKDRNA